MTSPKPPHTLLPYGRGLAKETPAGAPKLTEELTERQAPRTEFMRTWLHMAKTIAVVGYSPNEGRPSHEVAHAMLASGYRVFAVRPQLAHALGNQAYDQVSKIPFVPDIVDVFRKSEAVEEVINDCIVRGVQRLWLQEGVFATPSQVQRAKGTGMEIIMDRCIWKEYRALIAK